MVEKGLVVATIESHVRHLEWTARRTRLLCSHQHTTTTSSINNCAAERRLVVGFCQLRQSHVRPGHVRQYTTSL